MISMVIVDMRMVVSVSFRMVIVSMPLAVKSMF